MYKKCIMRFFFGIAAMTTGLLTIFDAPRKDYWTSLEVGLAFFIFGAFLFANSDIDRKLRDGE